MRIEGKHVRLELVDTKTAGAIISITYRTRRLDRYDICMVFATNCSPENCIDLRSLTVLPLILSFRQKVLARSRICCTYLRQYVEFSRWTEKRPNGR